MEFLHLKALGPIVACHDDEVVLKGSARDFFVSELWGLPRWGAESDVVVVGTLDKPGLGTAGVFGHACGRWWRCLNG